MESESLCLLHGSDYLSVLCFEPGSMGGFPQADFLSGHFVVCAGLGGVCRGLLDQSGYD